MYSEEVQLAILDELAEKQSDDQKTPIILSERFDDTQWEWNRYFLSQRGCIHIFCNRHFGLHPKGEQRRFELREKFAKELANKKSTQIQNGIWWMTLAILLLAIPAAIAAFPAFRNFVVQLLNLWL